MHQNSGSHLVSWNTCSTSASSSLIHYRSLPGSFLLDGKCLSSCPSAYFANSQCALLFSVRRLVLTCILPQQPPPTFATAALSLTPTLQLARLPRFFRKPSPRWDAVRLLLRRLVSGAPPSISTLATADPHALSAASLETTVSALLALPETLSHRPVPPPNLSLALKDTCKTALAQRLAPLGRSAIVSLSAALAHALG